jgi:hypothetical protein
MGACGTTEKETLQPPNSVAGASGPREVLVDAHCHVWRTWPRYPSAKGRVSNGAIEVASRTQVGRRLQPSSVAVCSTFGDAPAAGREVGGP